MSDEAYSIDVLRDEKSQKSSSHNISMMKISPNGNYLISYSKKDETIVGWNVEDKNIVDGEDIKEDHFITGCEKVFHMCVSDEKILATNIKFDYISIVCIYSIQAKKKTSQPKKSECQQIYKIPREAEVISISKHDKIWLRLDHNIYEWNLRTDELLCNFMNHHHCLLLSLFDYPLIWNSKTKCHEVCFKKNNQLNKLDFKLPNLFYDSVSKNYRFVIVDGHIQRIEYNGKTSESFNQQDDILVYQLDKGSIIWKIKIDGLEKQKFKIEDTLNKEMDIDIIEDIQNFIKTLSDIKQNSNNLESRIDKYKNPIEEFIKMKSMTKLDIKISQALLNDFIERLTIIEEDKDHGKWKNKIGELMKDFTKRINKIMELTKDPNQFKIKITKTYLEVNEDLIRLFGADKYLRDKDCNDEDIENIKISAYKILKNKEIALLTEIGIVIFHLNIDESSISLDYFYYTYQPEKIIENICKLPGYPKVDKMCRKDNDELIYGWVSYVKENNEEFLNYGSALLMFAIKVHDSDLIDGIYQRCLYLFNRDLESNKGFLSIINTSMPLLEKYYPEYIARYSSDTNMIIDSVEYKIEHLDTSHLYPFSNMEIVDLTPSIAWTKYTIKVDDMYYHDGRRIIKLLTRFYFAIQIATFFLTLPISFPLFHILNYFHLINEIYVDRLSKCYYKCYYYISKSIFPEKLMPTVTFVIPYIKFVSYPEVYSWWELFRPKPSPFVETINREIYKTWNGEALINFKWNAYGKYYYYAIWMKFVAFLGCFMAASTFSEDLVSKDIRTRLLIASIVLGFTHFTFEIRQLIYDPIKWFIDPWNYFDLVAFLVPTITSIYWLSFELFGVYFVIIVSVARKIASFLVILCIILLSFAHAFLILLQPRKVYSLDEPPANNDDPNNPWGLTDSYNQVLENGTIEPNSSFVQRPDLNTNMFIDYGTSLLSMYLYLTGDSNALSNWEYKNNPQLTILMVFFSLLIAVYLMNLLIGLLSNAIEEDNNRVSYFVQKAKILAEIELFYLFPNQRRKKTWFPDVIYYHADVDETRRKIKELIKAGEWNSDKFFEMKQNLLNMLRIQDKQDIQKLDALKKQLDDIQETLGTQFKR
ncbi:3153_t:CDS:2 [Funneliformis caledonium]|uniref:3153_t:CDS:1 n=1 Tax=Funneliformis caledonium TaxID=1117310 RepID=A0A9N8WGB3_9GLOM|nr:3153_t:CDS:2 [Funneliformis caledonium]